MRVSARLVAALCALLLVVAACSSDDDRQLPDGKGRLRVTIAGLPSGTSAKVTVDGPSGRQELFGSRDLDVSPGRYAITIAPIRTVESGKQLTRFGAEDVQRVEIAAGQAVDVAARYRLAVPDTTKIVETEAPSPIVQVTTDQVVLASGPYADRLRPGDAIVAGQGPAAPEGLCVRVTTVQRVGNRVIAGTAKLRLSDAIPAGVLQIMDAQAATGSRSAAGAGAEDLTLGGNFEAGAVHSSVSLKAQIDQDWSGTEIEWDLVSDQKFVAVKIAHAIKSTYQLGINIGGQLTRPELRDEKDLGICGKGRAIKVAKVVAPLDCEVNGVVKLRPTVKGEVQFSAETFQASRSSNSWRVGGGQKSYGPEQHETSKDANAIGKVGFNEAAEGSVEVSAGLEFKYEGGAGLAADLGIGASIAVGAKTGVSAQDTIGGSTPTFRAEANLFYQVGFFVDLSLFLDVVEVARIEFPAYTHRFASWSSDLRRDQVNERQPDIPRYTYQDLVSALPGYRPAGYQQRSLEWRGGCIDQYVYNVYTDWQKGCPIRQAPGRSAGAALISSQKGKPHYWIEAAVFPSVEAAERFETALRTRLKRWADPNYKTPTHVAPNTTRTWATGKSAADPVSLRGGADAGGIRVKRSENVHIVWPSGDPASSDNGKVAIDQYIFYRRHNAVVEAGGTQIVRGNPDPTATLADALPDVSTIMLGYLNNLGEPR